MNRKIHLVGGLLLLVMLLISISAGCAQSAPTPKPPSTTPAPAPATPAPTTAPQTAPSPQSPTPKATAVPASPQWNFNFALAAPEKHSISDVTRFFRDEVGKRTGGAIKITVYYMEALGKLSDHPDLIGKGIIDMGIIAPSYDTNRFPLTNIYNLPFTSPSPLIGTRAYMELYKKGYFDKEYADSGLKPLWFFSLAPSHLWTKKQISSADDLKGIKVRSYGGYGTQVLEKWGAVPVILPITETYSAMDKGVISGIFFGFASGVPYNFQEVSKYITEIGIAGGGTMTAMNKGTFSKLPKDFQQIIDDVSAEAAEMAGKLYGDADDQARAVCLKAGVQIQTLPPGELSKLQVMSKPVISAWLDDMSAKGLPAKDAWSALVSALAKQGVKLAY